MVSVLVWRLFEDFFHFWILNREPILPFQKLEITLVSSYLDLTFGILEFDEKKMNIMSKL